MEHPSRTPVALQRTVTLGIIISSYCHGTTDGTPGGRSPHFREALRQALSPRLAIVGVCNDGSELIQKALRLRPDVIISDIAMPQMDGLEALRRIRTTWPSARAIFLTDHRDPIYVTEAIKAGARGYLNKRRSLTDLMDAIYTIWAGCNYFPSPGTDLAADITRLPVQSAVDRLSTRQIQVLSLLAEGHLDKEIAQSLAISPKTVEFHKASLQRKLRLRRTAQLIRFAIEHGLTGRDN